CAQWSCRIFSDGIFIATLFWSYYFKIGVFDIANLLTPCIAAASSVTVDLSVSGIAAILGNNNHMVNGFDGITLRSGKSASNHPRAPHAASETDAGQALWLPSGRHHPYSAAFTLLRASAIRSTHRAAEEKSSRSPTGQNTSSTACADRYHGDP